MPLLYAAYGSNLNHAQMRRRCPGARPVNALLLPAWRLVLRKYADMAPDAAALCPVGLWQITRAHLGSLDRYEGYPQAYTRQRLELPDGSEAWVYLERAHRAGPPTRDYVACIRAGYADFGFDPAPLEAALRGV
jgi:gamma-glutamylcyclotransferase (GGCT)/AIG2-like uncharacterized protein YtfP